MARLRVTVLRVNPEKSYRRGIKTSATGFRVTPWARRIPKKNCKLQCLLNGTVRSLFCSSTEQLIVQLPPPLPPPPTVICHRNCCTSRLSHPNTLTKVDNMKASIFLFYPFISSRKLQRMTPTMQSLPLS